MYKGRLVVRIQVCLRRVGMISDSRKQFRSRLNASRCLKIHGSRSMYGAILSVISSVPRFICGAKIRKLSTTIPTETKKFEAPITRDNIEIGSCFADRCFQRKLSSSPVPYLPTIVAPPPARKLSKWCRVITVPYDETVPQQLMHLDLRDRL